MSHAARLAREDAITDALRAVTTALGDDLPTDQAFRIIDAIKRLRDGQPARVTSTERRDYMAEVQERARTAWTQIYLIEDQRGADCIGPQADATAGIDTPLGRLRVTTWRRSWIGERGQRIAWASEYYLSEEPITVAEIKAAGLAQRPTTRRRRKL
ncbi:hypothetical protein SAMN05428953_12675 [Mesorhizobium muleiense]|uniref:Uncharacterized protein n=1 Tax=Mesorhizobium muleiense TaxID=1004279 RepID=A0A1G9H5N2_9HYPH|nr:hypothetical protein [Mesorhizobium muleiense]SDL08195.1 hypothetical protein SAMN05428953_12675 [Mesorhizobium muleiense]